MTLRRATAKIITTTRSERRLRNKVAIVRFQGKVKDEKRYGECANILFIFIEQQSSSLQLLVQFAILLVDEVPTVFQSRQYTFQCESSTSQNFNYVPKRTFHTVALCLEGMSYLIHVDFTLATSKRSSESRGPSGSSCRVEAPAKPKVLR